jgi:hypothetical protein
MSSQKTKDNIVDLNEEFDFLAKDVMGDDDESSDDEYDFRKKGGEAMSDFERDGEEDKKNPEYTFFDFRKGPEGFPANCEIVGPARAEVLLEKQTAMAEEALKVKKCDKDDQTNDKEGPKNILGSFLGFHLLFNR